MWQSKLDPEGKKASLATRSGKFPRDIRDAQLDRDQAKSEREALRRKIQLAKAKAEGKMTNGKSNSATDTAAAAAAAEEVDFDQENGRDDPDFYKKQVVVEYDQNDLKFWFLQLEEAMTFAGIKSQYVKRMTLTKNLPTSVKEEMKDLLSLTKSEAGPTCYKDVKDRLMELFGPEDTDAYTKASKLVMTGKPSQLAKRIAYLMCDCRPKPLAEGCCSVKAVAGMWTPLC